MTGNFANWDGNITDIGPIYPFVGWETLMVIVLVVFWIGWHIVQIRMENRDARRRRAAASPGRQPAARHAGGAYARAHVSSPRFS